MNHNNKRPQGQSQDPMKKQDQSSNFPKQSEQGQKPAFPKQSHQDQQKPQHKDEKSHNVKNDRIKTYEDKE